MSKTYMCEQHRHVVDDSDLGTYRECVVTDPYPMYENWSCCPECGSTDIAEAGQCEHCEEWFFLDELDDAGECPECSARPEREEARRMQRADSARSEEG